MKTNIRVLKCVRRKKIRAINEFGGKCQKCGYNKCLTALEFHHLDSKNKLTSPSNAITRWSWDRAIIELKKCILVCANCHREIHEEKTKIEDISLIYGKRKLIEKKCKHCNKKFITINSKQITCSNYCRSFLGRKVKRPTKEELKKELDLKKSWC